MFSEGSRKQALWLTLGVVLVALLCRLPPMTRSFWLDEVFSVGVAQHTPLEIAREIAPRDVHPPLYYMVLSVWGGTSEFRVRALSLLAGLLQIAALGLVVREMGNARAGWIAAYLAAAAHPLCWPSYEARSFALMNLFATLAWFFLVRSLKKGGRWPWIALGVCMAGTLYTFYYGFFALLALGALFLCSRPTRRQWLGFLAASGLAYLLFFPWVHVLLDQMSRGGPGGWLDPLGPVQTIKHHFFHVTPWRQLSWFGSAFVGALLVLAYRRRERHTPDANRWLAATLAMTLVLALSLVTTNLLLGFFSVRYSTFLAAPWIALFALAMLRIRAGSAWADRPR